MDWGGASFLNYKFPKQFTLDGFFTQGPREGRRAVLFLGLELRVFGLLSDLKSEIKCQITKPCV
jgi:hypothetical protein